VAAGSQFLAVWGDHTFRGPTGAITVIIDPGVGGIDVTFSRHNQS
jgi:N-acetylmuramoyl-L-alanine amidase